jgi:hypothetical protein
VPPCRETNGLDAKLPLPSCYDATCETPCPLSHQCNPPLEWGDVFRSVEGCAALGTVWQDLATNIEHIITVILVLDTAGHTIGALLGKPSAEPTDFHLGWGGVKRYLRSGGVTKVVTMTMTATALNSPTLKTPLSKPI